MSLAELDFVAECERMAEVLVDSAPGANIKEQMKEASKVVGVNLKGILYRSANINLEKFQRVVRAYHALEASTAERLLEERATDAVIAGQYRNLSEARVALAAR